MRWLSFLLFLLSPTLAFANIYDRVAPFESERWRVDAELIGSCMLSVRFDGDFKYNAAKNCVGIGAARCLEDSVISDTQTYDRPSYGNCLDLEKAYWEWRLGRTVAALSGKYVDQSEREQLLEHVPELEATIASWRAYVTIRCRYATHNYGVAPSRGREGDVAEWFCQNRQTASFALDLEAQFRGYCGSQVGGNYGTACEFEN